MTDLIFRISPNIILGPYTISRLGQQVKEWGSRYMIVIDPLLNEAKLAEKILQSLIDRKVESFVFAEIAEGNTSKVIERALSLAREGHVHGIIAVGGAKAMHIGRAVAALFNETNNFYSYIDGAALTSAPLPCICVPTTFRWPFCFTSTIPLTDSRSNQLKILKAQNTISKLILVDPNMMLSLTENQKATLSLELIGIATEAYLSQKANFFSDMYVEKGLEILSYALDGSPSLEISTPEEVLLSQAGCMISLAAATASLGIGSLVSMGINSRFHKSKSLVSSIMLPYVLEDAAKFKESKLDKIAHILRAATPEITGEEAVKALIEYIRQKIAKYNLPTRLKDLHLTVENLSITIEDVGSMDIMTTLPRSMTADDLFSFIKQAY
jgi:alcohol dehydrogenase class IV